jgi:hypothetical protein
MMDKSLIKKIKSKREFSELREIDIEKNFELFSKKQISEEEKISLTKEQLRKLFSAFLSKKLLSLKDKPYEWILRKHISTRERLPYYDCLYKKLFLNTRDNENLTVFDLGVGINGFSYNFFPKNKKIEYIGFESVGQLVNLTNYFFKTNNIKGKCFHLSLFELEEIKKIIKEKKGKKIVFLFKIIDALESVELDYSKKLIFELMPLIDEIVLSFSTKSLGGKNKFKVDRKWILNFIKENFDVLEEFEFGNEKYIVFKSHN